MFGVSLGTAFTTLAGISGCNAPAERPERALSRFVGHVRRGRANEAWAALSTETQRKLKADHRALAAAARRPPTDDIDEILFDELRLRALAEPDSVVVVGPLGERVRLRITVPDGPSAEMWMVREDGAWKVDLTRSLAATSSVAAAPAVRQPGIADVPQPATAGVGATVDRPQTSTPSASRP